MTPGSIEAALEAARGNEVDARAWGWSSTEHMHAVAEVERLERRAADARGEEYATPVDLRVTWDPNADDAWLVHHEDRARLVVRPDNDDPDPRRVVIAWSRCRGAVMSGPNDEERLKHRLWHSGLSGCVWAAEVSNSRWIRELEGDDRPLREPGAAGSVRHFILLLKETTFECIADDYTVLRVEDASAAAWLGW